VQLFDVLVLGKPAFTTASNNGNTLKSILEDLDIPKCAWDVRNDADALWALYHVGLAGVTNIQLSIESVHFSKVKMGDVQRAL